MSRDTGGGGRGQALPDPPEGQNGRQDHALRAGEVGGRQAAVGNVLAWMPVAAALYAART